MKEKKKILLSLAALAAAAVLLLGLWYVSRPQPQVGEKTVVVQVIHGDRTSKEFTCRTGQEYLGPMLLEEALVQGDTGPYGLFITAADGETARDELHQWWCITRDGQQVDTGADSTPIADGDHFELTLSTY